ncbi:deoxycytidylate deaminase [Acinetobacter baumannii]|uniref:deoxycytidylate deaminase n=1 Tax=Acinetobacter baumannii TaxID=470 RepID=UPI00366EAE9F
MSWNNLSNRWKDYFIKELHLIASMSRDVDTKVGAIIIDTENKVVIAKGYNDLPRGVYHHVARNSRPLKYKYTTHAEMNALFNALYQGVSVKGATMLCTLFSCSTCCGGVIQSGIKEFVCPEPDWEYPSLKDDFPVTSQMYDEALVHVIFEEKLSNV